LTIAKKSYVESMIEKHHRRTYLFRKFHRVWSFLSWASLYSWFWKLLANTH